MRLIIFVALSVIFTITSGASLAGAVNAMVVSLYIVLASSLACYLSGASIYAIYDTNWSQKTESRVFAAWTAALSLIAHALL